MWKFCCTLVHYIQYIPPKPAAHMDISQSVGAQELGHSRQEIQSTSIRDRSNVGEQISPPATSGIALSPHDQRIRSASTLASMLWHSSDFTPEPNENKEELTDATVARLTHLAQCLTRLTQENVAVGLLENSIQHPILVSRTSVGKCSGTSTDDNYELSHAPYATNSLSAGSKVSDGPNETSQACSLEGLDAEAIKRKLYETVYQYRSPSKGSKGFVRSLDHRKGPTNMLQH